MFTIVSQDIAPGQLSEEGKVTLGLLGVFIADHPERIRKLLREYGIYTSDKPGSKELVHIVLNTLTQADEDFVNDLAALLQEKLPPVQAEHQNYNPQADHYDSYMQVISSAISSIGQALGGVTNKRALEKQASNQTLQTIAAYEAQKRELALREAQLAARQQARLQKQKNIQTTVLIIAGVAIVGIGGWYYYKHSKELITQTATT